MSRLYIAESRSPGKDPFVGCTAGPKLVVHYTGLVEAPRNVSFEQVTGHSTVVKWETSGLPQTALYGVVGRRTRPGYDVKLHSLLVDIIKPNRYI